MSTCKSSECNSLLLYLINFIYFHSVGIILYISDLLLNSYFFVHQYDVSLYFFAQNKLSILLSKLQYFLDCKNSAKLRSANVFQVLISKTSH